MRCDRQTQAEQSNRPECADARRDGDDEPHDDRGRTAAEGAGPGLVGADRRTQFRTAESAPGKIGRNIGAPHHQEKIDHCQEPTFGVDPDHQRGGEQRAGVQKAECDPRGTLHPRAFRGAAHERDPLPQDPERRDQPERDENHAAEIRGPDRERRQDERGENAQPQLAPAALRRTGTLDRAGLRHGAQDPVSASPPNRRSRRRYSASACSSAARSKSGQ